MHNFAIDPMLGIILYVQRPICELKRKAGQRRKEKQKGKKDKYWRYRIEIVWFQQNFLDI